jgi:hypothetical protein
MQTISQADLMKKATRFNAPEFLSCVIKHGLLKADASLEEAYEVFGKLLHVEVLLAKRLKLGMVAGIESLTAAELCIVRENVRTK